MDIAERQMAPDVAEVAEVGEQLAQHSLGLPTERHSRSPYSTSVIGASCGPRMWSRSGSTSTTRIHEQFELAGQRPRTAARRQHRHEPEDQPAQCGRADRGAEDAELRLVEAHAGECDRRDQQRDGEADAGDDAAAERRTPTDR